jgi:anti-sigma-K factor RskA
MSSPGIDNIDELAGDYVLGTLSATRRREIEQRLPDDAALRAAVQRWHERLLPLAALAEPVEPSAQLWQRIEGSLAQTAAPATPRRAAIAPAKTSWWDSVRLWRGLAGTGFAAAALMAAVLVTRQAALPTAPQFMVVLVAPQDKAPGWVVQASSTRQLSLIPLGPTEVPAEKSLQFWTKGESWSGPVSLGLVKPGQTIQIPLDKLPPLQPNQLFELTLEPVNGSPLDRPTGPIQFIGRAVKVL